MLPLITPIATVSGTVSALLPVLQIARMRRRGDSSGLSIPFISGVVVHLSIWTAYGIALRNPTMMFTSALALTTNVTMLAITLALRRAAVLDEQQLVEEIRDDAGAVRHDANLLAKLEPVAAA